jgi:hypothetical protein
MVITKNHQRCCSIEDKMSLKLDFKVRFVHYSRCLTRNNSRNFLFVGDDLLEFHQAVVSTLRDADDVPIPLDPAPMIPHSHSTHHPGMMMPPINDDLGRISDTVNTDQDPEDDMDPGRVA